MILFIGSSDRGFFAEEIAVKKGEKFAYVDPNIHIRPQMPVILQYSDTTCMIFDLEQYEDKAAEIADAVIKLSRSNNAKVIIYASGYIPQSQGVTALYEKGIRNFIFSTSLSGIKEEYELCIAGFYEANGIDVLENLKEENPEEEESQTAGYTKIGIAGACPRIGTTTQCIQLIKDLIFRGYKACYIQMNNTNYLNEYLSGWFVSEEIDEELGRIKIEGIDHFYKLEKLPKILTLGYDFYVYDYGTYKDNYFNKTSFLEKDARVFVVGSKPGEFSATKELIDNMFYTESYYIFNLTPENEKEDLLAFMEEKAVQTYFSEIAKDKYVLAVSDIYGKIIPAEAKRTDEAPKKKRRFFGRNKS